MQMMLLFMLSIGSLRENGLKSRISVFLFLVFFSPLRWTLKSVWPRKDTTTYSYNNNNKKFESDILWKILNNHWLRVERSPLNHQPLVFLLTCPRHQIAWPAMAVFRRRPVPVGTWRTWLRFEQLQRMQKKSRGKSQNLDWVSFWHL